MNKRKETTIAIPMILHTKVKIFCARRNLKIKMWVKAILERTLSKERL